MKYFKDYPLVKGKLKDKNTLIARCPYCNRIEHFNWNKTCANPSRRRSHCISGNNDYYYILIPTLKGGEINGRESNV